MSQVNRNPLNKREIVSRSLCGEMCGNGDEGVRRRQKERCWIEQRERERDEK